MARWNVGQRLLEERLAGHGRDACLAAERARGIVPPGEIGTPLLDEVLPTVDGIVAAATAAVDDLAVSSSFEVNVDLGDGRSVVGTVPGVVGDVLRTVTFSRVGPKQRLATWIRFLALTASRPGRPFAAVTVGRGSRVRCGTARIAALEADAAREQLRRLADLYARGMREPLPLYRATSAAYAAATPAARVSRARGEWETARGFDREDRDPAHRLVLAGVVPFDDLLAAPPRDDEEGSGWPADESTRFGRYARRLWDDLLAVERREDL